MATVRNSSIKIEDEREPQGPTINQILHAPILMLKFIGVYIESFSMSRTTVLKVFSNCLVMIMGILVIARFIAGFVVDSYFSGELTGRLTFAISYISNIVMFPVFVVNSSRNLHRVLARFSTYQSKHGLSIDTWKSKRRTNEACALFVIIGVVYLVSVFASVSLRIFPESGLFVRRLLPFGYKDGHVFDLVSLQDTVTIEIFMFIVNLEIVIACVLSHIIIREFQSVNTEADIYVRQSNVSAADIGKLRCRHFKVTQLLQAANCLIQPIVLLLYIIMLPSICLTVYGIVHSTLGLLDMIMLIQLLIAYIFGVTLLTGIGAMIYSQVIDALFLSFQTVSYIALGRKHMLFCLLCFSLIINHTFP